MDSIIFIDAPVQDQVPSPFTHLQQLLPVLALRGAALHSRLCLALIRIDKRFIFSLSQSKEEQQSITATTPRDRSRSNTLLNLALYANE
jgi:hypothetical protein